MMRFLTPLLLALAAPAIAKPAQLVPLPEAKPGQFVDLTPEFVVLAREGAGRSDAELIAAFHKKFGPLLPGFFDGRGDRQARYDARIVTQLRALAKDSAAFEAAAAAFGKQYRTGQRKFARAFRDYRPSVPVYLIHSFGQMDGGTRNLADRYVLLFGADVIAREHDTSTMAAFFDHEFFHVYHGGAFDPGCEGLWCGLWVEGLGTYAAAQLNPGASDRALLLDSPVPLRAALDPRLAEAMCRVRVNFDSKDEAINAEAFNGGSTTGPFPARYGYYLGYVLAGELGETIPLAKLATMPTGEVKPLLRAALERYDCAQGNS